MHANPPRSSHMCKEQRATREELLSKLRIALLPKLHTTRYQAHKDLNPERVGGTCQWVLNHEQFLAWRNNQDVKLLWVAADAGCGKSVLAKFLGNNELTSADSEADSGTNKLNS